MIIAQVLTLVAAAMVVTDRPAPDKVVVVIMRMHSGRERRIALDLGCALDCLIDLARVVFSVSATVAAPRAVMREGAEQARLPELAL